MRDKAHGSANEGAVRGYVTERARFSQRSYVRFYPSLNQADDEGKLCRARREVLHASERTRVRDRAGTVLTTQLCAILPIIETGR